MPIVVSKNEDWKVGKAFDASHYGQEFEVSEKVGKRLIKMKFFIEAKQPKRIIKEIETQNTGVI